ncbi:MAG: nucleotide exchange factor GrpE [Synergistaceae bacterium]|nr:nucleotide exchange factor GrpE [Synergistaceae bacterium]
MTRKHHDPSSGKKRPECAVPREDPSPDLQPGGIPPEEILTPEEEPSPTRLELLDSLGALEEEMKEMANALALARADFFNYRKRVERDRQRERAMAGEEKTLDFLPVLDNLDRALAVPPDADAKSILQGVSMVRRQFLSVIQDQGVDPIPTVGVPFSPEVHEAVATVPSDDPSMNGIIVEEILPGYRTDERVLRPAKVKVASFSENTGNQP